MVWAAMGHNYLEWRILPQVQHESGRLDEMRFVALTQEYYRQQVLPKTMKHCRDNGLTFMQDGARPHTAKKTLDYIAGKRVELLAPWPPRSPDANPIETLWAIVAPRVAKHFALNREELVAAIEYEFTKLATEDIAIVNNLVDSFPTRMEAIIAKKGEF